MWLNFPNDRKLAAKKDTQNKFQELLDVYLSLQIILETVQII